MHKYRTHKCSDLRLSDKGQTVKISGWIHRKRDHGNLLFVDLRDNYGITQVVTDTSSDAFQTLEKCRVESVVCVTGEVLARDGATINSKLPTGEIEVKVSEIEVLSNADVLPIQVAADDNSPEELRLKYRFLDLRKEKLHKNILLRSQVISSMRKRMTDMGFVEFQTPILTASSPEGARDFLVPSRLHPGQFYALPQAPQQFKQLLMVSGFDRYFQIAPCFRDEDSRADRSPGEFYQLDIEMSFVTQDDVFEAVGSLLHGIFSEFSNGKPVSAHPFVQIPYRESMAKYGSDKPDLRNPLVIEDVSKVFAGSDFGLFADMVASGGQIRAIRAPGAATQPRSWFDKLNTWAQENGQGGLGYITFAEDGNKGPIAKKLDEGRLGLLKGSVKAEVGDSVFFICGNERDIEKFSGLARTKLCEDLGLLDKDRFELCWIVDFPMYELDDDGKVEFSHNPFSMPHGGMDDLLNKDPLDILAYQYDIVCNGVELSSGAIRNHLPEVMYKAFEIAGYGPEVVESKFGGMLNAFKFGAPPHGGSAPGVDRIVMLLADEPNIREVILFPMTGQAQDLMMQAPNFATDKQLKELHLGINMPKEKAKQEKSE